MPADGMPATSQGAGAVRRARRAPGHLRGHRVRGKAPWPEECWQRARQSPRTRAQTRALLGDGAGVPVAITLWRPCSRQSGNVSLWGNPVISQMVGQAGRHREPLARVTVLSKFHAEWCRAPAPSSRDLVWPVPRPREPVGHRPPPGPPQRHRGTPEAEGSAPKFMNMHGARAGAELRADQTGTDRSPCRCRSLPRARPPPSRPRSDGVSITQMRPRGRHLEGRRVPLPLPPLPVHPRRSAEPGRFSSGSTFVCVKGD